MSYGWRTSSYYRCSGWKIKFTRQLEIMSSFNINSLDLCQILLVWRILEYAFFYDSSTLLIGETDKLKFYVCQTDYLLEDELKNVVQKWIYPHMSAHAVVLASSSLSGEDPDFTTGKAFIFILCIVFILLCQPSIISFGCFCSPLWIRVWER
jgi:hypothetical protein